MIPFPANKFVLLDGAMGTMLQKRGLRLGELPELIAFTHPELLLQIHREYLESGSQVLYTNTLGANAHKLQGSGYTPEQVISQAVSIAKEACSGTDALVALDVGPIGVLLEPSGTLSFEEAYSLFRQQMIAGKQAGVDLIVIETMTDLYEAKAALLAAKENTSLPVFVTLTFEENRRTFTGCSLSAMAAVLEGLGADAIGINCSLGPQEILPLMQELAEYTSLPLIVKANAGLPDPQTGEYGLSPQSFAQLMAAYCPLGVQFLGGCCGTTPETIREMAKLLQNREFSPRSPSLPRPSLVCTPAHTVQIDQVRVIGERINPTGKKRFQQALREGDLDYILRQGIQQSQAGAAILDVNVGFPGIPEAETMVRVVKGLQSVLDIPLQIDSSDPAAIEAGLRVYNGKAVVNSVNGDQEVLDQILPLVKKYGAAVIGLTLDKRGIPESGEDRLSIARRILGEAEKHGIPREDVWIDCLTLTASAQQAQAKETLRAVRMVKEELGLHTVLGISNISFGLPNRELVNQNFLTLAMGCGLDLPILNPNIPAMMNAVSAFLLLSGQDKDACAYLQRFAGTEEIEKTVVPSSQKENPADLSQAVIQGRKEEARRLTQLLLQEKEELEIINERLIPALDIVGARFEKGEIFLPQLIHAAGASQEAFDVIKASIAAKGTPSVSKGTILVATVKGDIHDIGKNIVKVLLENYGYRVVDLGRDVPVEKVVETAVRENIHLIGLSALMTTTLASMRETIAALRQSGHPCTVFVGGAVLTPEYAAEIGADFYAKDAKQAVDIARKVFSSV